MQINPLPEGWTTATLADVGMPKTRNITPTDFPDETFELWSVPIFSTGSPEIVLGRAIGSAKQLVQEGDVLLCKINPRINRVWQVGPKGPYRQIASTEWIVLRNNRMDSGYLRKSVSEDSFRRLLCDNVSGVGGSLTRARPGQVRHYSIPVPPLHEQRRIAERIDAIEAHRRAAKERLDRLPELLDQYRQSVLAAAFRGDLTAGWRAQNPDTKPAEALLDRIRAERRHRWIEAKAQKATDRAMADAARPWTEAQRAERFERERSKAAKKYEGRQLAPQHGDGLPKGWTWTTMEQVVETLQTGPFGSALHKSDYVEGGTPLVNPSNISGGRIIPDSSKAVSDETLKRLAPFLLREGDIVLGRRGEMGRCALVTPTEVGWLCGTGSLIVRAETTMSAAYLDALIRSPAVRHALEEASVGSTMSNLNQGVLQDLVVPLPPRDEQDEIVAQIAACSDRIEGISAAMRVGLEQVDRLRQATLARAFRGELVPTEAALARQSAPEQGSGTAPVGAAPTLFDTLPTTS